MPFPALLALTIFIAVSGADFDDAELERLLRSEERFVVCIWSPHMPLSAEAVHEVIRAGKSLGVPVIAVLDPRADLSYARSTAAALKLPPDVLRVARSTELMRRDAFQHAPTVIAFADGRQAGPARPGYLDAEGYAHLLKRYFAEKVRP